MKFGKINIHVDYRLAGIKPDGKVAGEPVREGLPSYERHAGYKPYMDAYLLDDQAEPKKRPAVIICPGGAYLYTSIREGEAIAMKFLAAGIQAFVLWYSVEPAVFPMALMELAAGVKAVRKHADEWNIDPNRIAVMGFSAGGHLAASLSTLWNKGFLADCLEAREDEIRPNATILGYPLIKSQTDDGQMDECIKILVGGNESADLDTLSLDKQVDSKTPPTFIFSAWNDDTVDISNTLSYMLALKKAGVLCESHIYSSAFHGISLANRETANSNIEGSIVKDVQNWIDMATTWLKHLK